SMSSAVLSLTPLTVSSFATFPLVPTARCAISSARDFSAELSTAPVRLTTLLLRSYSTLTSDIDALFRSRSIWSFGSGPRLQALPSDAVISTARHMGRLLRAFIGQPPQMSEQEPGLPAYELRPAKIQRSCDRTFA